MGQAKFLKDTYVSRGELHPDAAVFFDAAMRSAQQPVTSRCLLRQAIDRIRGGSSC
jgi:hypothetical protein